MDQLQGAAGRARPLGSAAITTMLKAQIADGTYGAGTLLPSTRALAAELGVSRTTVTIAYDQLAAEGYLDTRQGTRARVAEGLLPRLAGGREAAPEPAPAPLSAYAGRALALPGSAVTPDGRAPIDFRYGDMPAADFPTLAWKRALTAAVLARPERLAYEDPAGLPALRTALQGYLRRARGLACDADQILIVNGSQQAIDLCARLLVDPGDRVVVEEPGYPLARQALQAAGATLVPVPVDAQGLRTDMLERVPHARAALVTPSHQFPLGGVLPAARRRMLLDWAARAGAFVIEDDYDGEYRYGSQPIEALAATDGLRSVVYVGTFSKTLSPRLRLGYLVAPPALVPGLRAVKRLADRHSAVLEQAGLAAFIAGGGYERHVRRVRRLNGERRAALLAALAHELGDRVAVEGEAAGLHLVAWFRRLGRGREPELVAAGRRLGVGLHPVSPLYHGAGPDRPAGIVLGYAALSAAEIARGTAAIRRALDDLAA